jgi:hypothetical protein
MAGKPGDRGAVADAALIAIAARSGLEAGIRAATIPDPKRSPIWFARARRAKFGASGSERKPCGEAVMVT